MPRLGAILLDLGPLRRHRDFRFVLFGQLVNNLGRSITLIALPYQLYVMTRSPLAIGALAIVQLVPLLLLGMAGGAIADAMDRRRLLLTTQVGLMGCSGLLAIVATVPDPPIIAIYAIALAAACISAIDQPARSPRSTGSYREKSWAGPSPSRRRASRPPASSGRPSAAS